MLFKGQHVIIIPEDSVANKISWLCGGADVSPVSEMFPRSGVSTDLTCSVLVPPIVPVAWIFRSSHPVKPSLYYDGIPSFSPVKTKAKPLL